MELPINEPSTDAAAIRPDLYDDGGIIGIGFEKRASSGFGKQGPGGGGKMGLATHGFERLQGALAEGGVFLAGEVAGAAFEGGGDEGREGGFGGAAQFGPVLELAGHGAVRLLRGGAEGGSEVGRDFQSDSGHGAISGIWFQNATRFSGPGTLGFSTPGAGTPAQAPQRRHPGAGTPVILWSRHPKKSPNGATQRSPGQRPG